MSGCCASAPEFAEFEKDHMNLIQWFLAGFLNLFSDPFGLNPRHALFIFNLQDFNQKSVKIQKDFCIENGEYAITIMFYPEKNDPKTINLGRTLGLGSNPGEDHGVPINGIIEISNNTNEVVTKKTFANPESISTYKGRHAFLIEKHYLKKGCYKIKIDLHQKNIIFPKTKAQLNVENAYLGK